MIYQHRFGNNNYSNIIMCIDVILREKLYACYRFDSSGTESS